jgi:glycosyltransferase involved in cell wall biosynthesis
MIICHLTSVHSHNDTRIFLKECTSLVNTTNKVYFIVPGEVTKTINNVYICGVKKIKGNRFKRMTKMVYAVYRKALEINADVYHFHDPELIPVGLKLKSKGKKVIYDIHEDLPRALLSKSWIQPFLRNLLSKVFEIFENYSSKKFDCLITATPFITDRFKKINPNTININNYPLLDELQNSFSENPISKQKQVCYVGGLGPIRGIYQLLSAADKIKGTLHIAGPITPKKMEEQLYKHNNIEYVGCLDREGVKKLLASSVAGLVTFLPEPNHVNAQPNKMFEYMSAGIPIICSDFPLWKSIIEKHDCGICVDPENPSAIADAINFLFKNPDIAERMGKNGRDAVEKVYNWELEAKKLIIAYESIIK